MTAAFISVDDVSSVPLQRVGRPLAAAAKVGLWSIRFLSEVSFSRVHFYPATEPDTAAEPGVELSPEVMAFVRDRDALRQLATRFCAEGFAGAKISQATASAFPLLLGQLPLGGHLPRIAPDEGALTLQWSFEDRSDILALLDDWILHVIEAPATPEARYHPPIDLRNGVPPALIRSLRRRRPT